MSWRCLFEGDLVRTADLRDRLARIAACQAQLADRLHQLQVRLEAGHDLADRALCPTWEVEANDGNALD